MHAKVLARHRHRCRARPGRDARVRRGRAWGRAGRPAPGAQADPHLAAAAGQNFSLEGQFVEWQKWRFHLRFHRRTGRRCRWSATPGGRGEGRCRRSSCPDQDADPNWSCTYMDVGEFGFGLLASPLKLGLDVPENACCWCSGVGRHPRPERAGGAAAVGQGGGGSSASPATGVAPLRAVGRRLRGPRRGANCVRSIAQVGNYDYLLDWVFTQNGVIRGEVGLTGIDAPKGVGLEARPPGTEYGRSRRSWWRLLPEPRLLQLPPRRRCRWPRVTASCSATCIPARPGAAQARGAGGTPGRPARRSWIAPEGHGAGRSSTRPAQRLRPTHRLPDRAPRHGRAAARRSPTTSAPASSRTRCGSPPSTPTSATRPATRPTSTRAHPACRSSSAAAATPATTTNAGRGLAGEEASLPSS